MRSEDRATARRQLDKRLSLLTSADNLARPPRGWIKAIREALGMTTAQFGKRMGVSQPRAVVIEKAENTASITLGSLERAAQALDCRLVYALVPRKPLDKLVAEQAEILAQKRLESAGHSMKLEDQGVDTRDEREQLKSLIDKIIARGGSKLWEEA
ncbi:MAG: mobile mystery protein A [Candidatus Thiodiazotropha sp. (ex Dulcina madagascariensis)]|nr:mobile mystery protein A [Candidatus Thiodiazotropha sp. (ex Dulcina madagascariensis)]MCU7928814.1 mobile mystery protein A [Candidatus Thiodiazotropha sp. (ex Dulcina madagascariensis)]